MNDFVSSVKAEIHADEMMTDKALHGIAVSLAGKHIERDMTNEEAAKSAIMLILKFYRLKLPTVRLPENITDMSALLNYCVHTCGLIYREVRLDSEWYKTASGIMIGKTKDDGTSVVLLPNGLKGYRSLNLKTGKYTKMDKKAISAIDSEAICFYLPLPESSITIPGFIKHVLRLLSAADFVLFFSLAVIWAIMYSITPILMTSILHYHRHISTPQMLTVSILLILGISSGITGISLCIKLLKTRIGAKVRINTEAAWMQRMLHMPLKFHRKFALNEFPLCASAAKALGELMVEAAFLVVTVVFDVLALLISISQTQTPLILGFALIYMCCQLFFHIIVIIKENRVIRKQILLNGQTDYILYLALSEIRNIRLNGVETAAFTYWAERYADSTEMTYHPPFLFSMRIVISTAISLFAEVILYGLMINQGIDPYSFFLLSLSMWLLSFLINKLVLPSLTIATLSVSFKFAEPLMKSVPEDNRTKGLATHFIGSIEAADISFRYNEKQPFVIRNLSLEIAPGEFVAITGQTGCGKSTLIRILLGMETPDSGNVIIDYREISCYNLSSLRSYIGLVTKDDRLYSGTLRYNILMNSQDQTEEAAWKAAESACVADDIRKMPMGMNTVTMDNDFRFSSGQIQRLMIARAIARKPKILILDDAVGALDIITLKQLYQSLAKLGCTRIIASHSILAIRDADRIICMDKGSIAEQGNYNELTSRKGTFARLMQLQAE